MAKCIAQMSGTQTASAYLTQKAIAFTVKPMPELITPFVVDANMYCYNENEKQLFRVEITVKRLKGNFVNSVLFEGPPTLRQIMAELNTSSASVVPPLRDDEACRPYKLYDVPSFF